MITSAPSQWIQASFSQGGQGAARCQTVRRVETLYFARTSSGRRQMRLIMVGTRYIQVPPCASTAARVFSASKRGSTTRCAPLFKPPKAEVNGPL